MLRDRITAYLEEEISYEELTQEVCTIIKKSVEKNDSNLLDQFFGKEAYQFYLTEAQLEQLNAALQKNEEISEEKELYQYLNTQFLRAGLFFSCLKGNLKIAQYFLTNQRLPGDLTATIDMEPKFLELKHQLKGSPLRLAVESGNLDLVKYIYENTEATVETSIGRPLESTALMKACETQKEAIAAYLLEHGANPNAEKFASINETPLTIAINAGNTSLVHLLVMNGAIVSNKEVSLALTKNIGIPCIEFLMQHCVNREDPYHPYLLSAVESGNIQLFKEMEQNSYVKPLEEIAAFDEMNIEKRLLIAAAKSGELRMMRYLVEEKKLDLKRFLSEEYNYYEQQPEKESLRTEQQTTKTILYHAARNQVTNELVPMAVSMLQYLFENLKPSPAVIKKMCSRSASEIRTFAFLYSLISEDPTEKNQLEAIAFNLQLFNLVRLFKLYQSKFIHDGNIYAKDFNQESFKKATEQLIETKTNGTKPQQLLAIIEHDKEAAVGALFYFCTKPFDCHSETFCYLLTQLTQYLSLFSTVDIKNCGGDTLAKFACQQGSFHIVKQLLARGANPDEPNLKGETLLNLIIDNSYLCTREWSWIQSYIQTKNTDAVITNSLLFETTRNYGGYRGIETLLKFTEGCIGTLKLVDLLNHCCEGYNSGGKIKSLLSNLSPKYVHEMMSLIQDEHLRHKLGEDQLNDYFSKIKGFDFKKSMGSNYTKNSPTLFPVNGKRARSEENSEVNEHTMSA